MKPCIACGIVKPIDEFYVHPKMSDGHLNKCKKCVIAYAANRRTTNHARVCEIDAKRDAKPERKAKKYVYGKTYVKRNPEKARARRLVSYHKRTGKLQKLPCERCGNIVSQGHHEDYSKPLDVRWMCFKCHREEHGQVVERADYVPHNADCSISLF